MSYFLEARELKYFDIKIRRCQLCGKIITGMAQEYCSIECLEQAVTSHQDISDPKFHFKEMIS